MSCEIIKTYQNEKHTWIFAYCLSENKIPRLVNFSNCISLRPAVRFSIIQFWTAGTNICLSVCLFSDTYCLRTATLVAYTASFINKYRREMWLFGKSSSARELTDYHALLLILSPDSDEWKKPWVTHIFFSCPWYWKYAYINLLCSIWVECNPHV